MWFVALVMANGLIVVQVADQPMSEQECKSLLPIMRMIRPADEIKLGAHYACVPEGLHRGDKAP